MAIRRRLCEIGLILSLSWNAFGHGLDPKGSSAHKLAVPDGQCSSFYLDRKSRVQVVTAKHCFLNSRVIWDSQLKAWLYKSLTQAQMSSAKRSHGFSFYAPDSRQKVLADIAMKEAIPTRVENIFKMRSQPLTKTETVFLYGYPSALPDRYARLICHPLDTLKDVSSLLDIFGFKSLACDFMQVWDAARLEWQVHEGFGNVRLKGMSGGPAVDSHGQVIGVISAIDRGVALIANLENSEVVDLKATPSIRDLGNFPQNLLMRTIVDEIPVILFQFQGRYFLKTLWDDSTAEEFQFKEIDGEILGEKIESFRVKPIVGGLGRSEGKVGHRIAWAFLEEFRSLPGARVTHEEQGDEIVFFLQARSSAKVWDIRLPKKFVLKITSNHSQGSFSGFN